MNSKDVGDRSEAMVIAMFLASGMTVLQPFGDNRRYDIVIEESGSFKRVQVKTARIKGGIVFADTCSSYAHRGGSKRDYRGEADLFALYCPANRKLYLLPVSEASRTSVSLRLEPSRNGQKTGVKLAKDFEFNSRVG